jgi:hypothetical protein
MDGRIFHIPYQVFIVITVGFVSGWKASSGVQIFAEAALTCQKGLSEKLAVANIVNAFLICMEYCIILCCVGDLNK